MSTYNFVENMNNVFGISTKHIKGLSDQSVQKFIKEYDHAVDTSGDINSFYGQKHTAETKMQMSKAAKARPCNRKGVTLSNETKKLISKNNAAKKAIKTPYGIFDSKVEAAKVLGTTTETIRTIINENLDVPVSRKSRMFSKEEVGKTPRELGWGYV